jgi:transmembrane 9 superfamily protein 2/4
MVEDNNIGETLTGDTTFSTLYELKMFKNAYCQVLCNVTLSEFEEGVLKWMIDHDYRATYYLDNLPAGLNGTYKGDAIQHVYYDHGIPIGEKLGASGKQMIFNHLTFNIHVHLEHNVKEEKHSNDKPKYSIVGFDIIPAS